MRTHLSIRARRVYFTIMAVAFFVAVPVLVSYSLGYRLNGNGKITRIGGITLNDVPAGATVFLRGKEAGNGSLLDDEIFIGGLLPGEYEVKVVKKGFAPWQKTLAVVPQKVNVQKVLAIPQPVIFHEVIVEPREKPMNGETKAPNAVTISQSRADELETLFRIPPQHGDERSLVFGPEAKVLCRFGGLEVVQKKDQMMAGWAGVDDRLPKTYTDESGLPLRVFSLGKISEEILDIDFLPDRYEMALITLPSGLYLTEINARPAYILFPLYEKPGLIAVVDDEGELYVKDGDRLLVLDSKL